MKVSCELSKIIQPEEPTLTVGERFNLICKSSGEIRELPAVKVPEELKYHFVPLNIEVTGSDSLNIAGASNVVGAHQLEGITLTLEGQEIGKLEPLRVEVRSMQDPANPVQEPYGVMWLDRKMPPWLPVTIILVLLFLLMSSFFTPWWLKRRGVNRFKKFLSKCDQVLPPAEEFFREVRKIKKSELLWKPEKMEVFTPELGALYEQYFLSLQKFIGRTFHLPLTEIKPRAQDVAIQKLKDQEDGGAVELSKIWSECRRLQKVQIKGQDLTYLVDWTSQVVSDMPKRGQKNG